VEGRAFAAFLADRVGQPLPDGLERGVSHVRAGPVAEDQQVARIAGPD
jgi:hypothetical protein